MRILSLRLENLNSLAGCWEIDFSHPAYAVDGLFAIIGPTGAGKSTLLDAICLALYGATPRLEKITQADNQLMSRQAGDCLAEVTFETEQGRFLAHWSQHRARHKADGNLQAPRHELAEADSGKLLASSLRQTPIEVERITGMDFARFTRSMLLAQGEFAAFLSADGDQRAPLLEQITGTEIYSRISMQVHEIHAEVKREYEQLQAQCSRINTLDAESLRDLAHRRDDLEQAAETLKQQLETSRSALHWHTELQRLRDEQSSNNQRLEALSTEILQLAPQRQALELAEKAAQLTHQQQTLEQKRRGSRELTAHVETLRQEVTGQESLLLQLKQTAVNTLHTLEEARQALEQARPALRKAREREMRRNGLLQQHVEVAAQLDQSHKRHQALAQSLEQQNAQLLELRRRQGELEAILQSQQADADLASRLPALKLQVEGLQRQLGRSQKLHQEIDVANGQQRQMQNNLANLRAQRNEQGERTHNLEHQREELKRQIDSLLSGWSESELQNETDRGTQRLNALKTAVDLAQRLGTTDAIPLSQKIDQTQTQLELIASKLQGYRNEEQRLQEKRESLQREHALRMRIASLEQMRSDLRSGEPCPLCGATEHPYQKELPAVADDDGLHELDLQLQQIVSQRESLLQQERIAVGELEKSKAALQRERDDRHQLEQQIQQLGVGADPEQLCEALQQQQAHCDALKERRGKLFELNRQLLDTGGDLEISSKRLAELDRALERQIAELEGLDRQLTKLKEEQSNVEQETGSLWREIQECLKGEQGGALTPESLPDHLQQLEQRCLDYQQALEELQSLGRQVSELDNQVTISQERLADESKTLRKQTEEAARLKSELQQIEAELAELTGGESADTLEQRLEEALQRADREAGASREAEEETSKKLGLAQQALQLAREQHDRSVLELADAEAAFAKSLAEHGFPNEAAMLEAQLPAAELQRLREAWQERERKLQQLQIREQHLQESIEQHRLKSPGDQDKESWQQLEQHQSEELSSLQQKIGAIRQQLDDNRSRQEALERERRNLERQRALLDQWQRLHQLIGSADGKKFRNFAQALTFGQVIREANRHLRSMSDRYQLLADPLAPLQLQVIDDYQAGEIRSTRNLSGGESFLVSLALALGLSRLNSGGMRVDSLFLDEGFGSLDEESLECALEALMELRQQGKLIGLISHVGAMQERIATQIRVIPGSAGVSRIEAPGCSRC